MDYSKLGNRRNRRKQNPHTTRVRNKVGLIALRVTLALVLIVGFGAMGAGLGLYFGILGNSPELDFDMVRPVYQSSVIVDARTNEELIRLHAGHNSESVTIDQIPLHVQNAFIAIEDERFWEHNGVDIRGIGRATYRLITSGGATTEGASTITQQLIKNMLRRFDSNAIYKLQEQYLAITFERELTERWGRQAAKEFILESYLNIINLGRSNYGVQAAALFYYGVDVWDLTIAQAATIAAITQNPSRFPPDTRPEANWVRAQHVLDSMHRLGFITDEELEEALNSDVYSTIVRTEGGDVRSIISPFDCFTNALLDAVRDDLMTQHNLTRDMANIKIFTGGLRIYSTQNHQMQAAVDRVFLDDSYWPAADFTIDIEFNFSIYNTITNQTRHYRVNRTVRNMDEAEDVMAQILEERMMFGDEVANTNPLFTPQPQAAFVLLDHHTGHVLALRGVRGESGANRTLNRATQQVARSPGSQMKPIATFAPAFDMGIMQPATVIDDIPFTLVSPSGSWTPNNWWGSSFEGMNMTARRAIYRSANVSSARATADPSIPHVGVQTMFDYLRRMGITSLVDGQDGAAVTLGGMHRGVHLIELAGAYGLIANGGYFNRPVLYTMVLGPEGEIVLENNVAPEQVLRDTTAYLLIDTMRNTLTNNGATGHAAAWANNPQMRRDIPAAGKTGTSQDNRDLGFTGFTPYLTGAIWMGNDNNARMHPNTRSNHTVAWRSIMQEIHEGMPPRAFERPAGRIVSVTICRDSGLLPGPYCNHDPRGGRTRSEIFDSRFAPTEICDVHQEKTYCAEHGYLAGANCPPWSVVTRVGLVRRNPIAVENASVWDRHLEFPQGVLDGLYCPYHLFPPDLSQDPNAPPQINNNLGDGAGEYQTPGGPIIIPPLPDGTQPLLTIPPLPTQPTEPPTENNTDVAQPTVPPPTQDGDGEEPNEASQDNYE